MVPVLVGIATASVAVGSAIGSFVGTRLALRSERKIAEAAKNAQLETKAAPMQPINTDAPANVRRVFFLNAPTK